jgi:hypothetical protein
MGVLVLYVCWMVLPTIEDRLNIKCHCLNVIGLLTEFGA